MARGPLVGGRVELIDDCGLSSPVASHMDPLLVSDKGEPAVYTGEIPIAARCGGDTGEVGVRGSCTRAKRPATRSVGRRNFTSGAGASVSPERSIICLRRPSCASELTTEKL